MYQSEDNSFRQKGQKEVSAKEELQSLGKKIKFFREQKKITQSELAEELSVTRQAVSNWERDKTLPDVYMLQQIAACFDMTLDAFVEGTREAEIAMPKMPGYLAAATGGIIFFYLIAGGVTGHLYVETTVIMVIIGIFCQLFLHLYFSGVVRTGTFSTLAGYDNKVEYNLKEVKKVVIQMDIHVACSSFGTVLLFCVDGFLAGNQREGFFEILTLVYCINLTTGLLLYNYRSLDRTLVREQDRKTARAGFISNIWFIIWVFVFIGAIYVKFTANSIENNSSEAVGYLGWIFLFLLVTVTVFFYEQHRVKKKMAETGNYRPGAAFWIGTALTGAVTFFMLFI